MPEGDTLFRLAMRLRPVLGGQTLVAATSLGAIAADTLAGLAVRDVEVRGKHLMIHLGDDSTLHIHLGMSGRFFVNALNEPGLRAAVTASLVLETATHRVVAIERSRQGDLARSTYFCPTCQGVQMPGRPSA